jgi:glycosyltransferase involved in cell wall biosynthesis
MSPLFSVVIPVFNRREIVIRAIDSILKQEISDYEIIIIDDGSNDGTADFIYSRYPKIKIIRIKNSGPAIARNIGIQNAQGLFIVFLDSDDISLPIRLSYYKQIIDNYYEVKLITSKSIDVSEPNYSNNIFLADKINYSVYNSLSQSRVNIMSDFILSGVCVRRDILIEYKSFSEWPCNYEDLDLWLRLSDVHKYEHINNVLTYRYIHGENITFNSKKNIDGIFLILKSFYLLFKENLRTHLFPPFLSSFIHFQYNFQNQKNLSLHVSYLPGLVLADLK